MSDTNGHNNGTAVLERVKAAIAEDQANGKPLPSQNDLASRLGTTRARVRTALAKLADQPASPPPATSNQQPVPAPRPAPWRTAGDLADGPGRQVANQPAPWRPPIAHAPPAWRQAPVRPVPAAAPPPKRLRLWPLTVIGLAAFVALWSGWVGLGAMTGFGPMRLLPGIWDGFVLNTAVVLPISLEAYAWFALRVLLASSYSTRTTRMAKKSAWFALGIGGAAQASYHLMEAASWSVAPWPVTMLVSVIPIVVLALAASLAHLVRQDRQAGASQ